MKKYFALLIFILAIMALSYTISAKSIDEPKIEIMHDDSEWAQPEPGDEMKPSHPGDFVAEFNYKRLKDYYDLNKYKGYLEDALIDASLSALPGVHFAIKSVASISLTVLRKETAEDWTYWVRALKEGQYRAVRIEYKYDLVWGYKLDRIYGVK